MSMFEIYFKSSMNNLRTGQNNNDKVKPLMAKYPDLWKDGLGRFNKFKVELNLKENTEPKFFKPRSVPFALKAKVDEELNRLVDIGVLVPIKFSKFATPIVPVLKEDGKVKIAGDYSITLNKVLNVDKYPLPRIEEVFAKLGGGEHYSRIDLKNAYNQFELSEQSQELTTITTQTGLYKYTRLVYGLANAPAIFQRSMETLLMGIEGVSVWLDDVCITGRDEHTHLQRLEEVLRRLNDAGLRLQKDKCEFFQDSVTYLGYVIDKNGLRTCAKKVEAIIKAPTPSNVLELKRFLGVVNYYRSFIPNASSLMKPLHELLCNEARWEWGAPQQRAFDSVKRALADERVLAHFDPEAQLVLSVDAGPAGLGAVLAQRDADGVERPLAFASRLLAHSEKHYSQIQKEATAIIFGVKKFHQYLYGRQVPFILKTDHRPLLSIFGTKNGVSIMAASRLQRYAIILSAYNYKVQYITSHNNLVADYFSRAPLPIRQDEQIEETVSFVNFLDNCVAPVSFADIQKATNEDEILQIVIKYMTVGWPRKIKCKNIMPFFNCKTELEVQDGCLLRGHRIVIPSRYRERMLKELHTAHFGIVKTKTAARSKMWWPGIDRDIDQLIGSCYVCASTRSAPPRAPPAPWPRPAGPWQRIHIDYMSIGQKTYLIVIDAYSKWLECIEMNSCSTTALIKKLKYLFSIFGIAETIVSDNDVKINSTEFIDFCRYNSIKYINSPIYHPCSNGQAENSVKTCKKMIKCILKENDSSGALNDKLLGFLFEYRNTSHCSTGVSPAKLMLGRDLRSRLDAILPRHKVDIDNDVSDVPNKPCSLNKSRQFTVGDTVWFKWFVGRKPFWSLGKIVKILGNRMFEIFCYDYNISCKRHVDQVMKYTGSETIVSPSTANIELGNNTGCEVVSETSQAEEAGPGPSSQVFEPTIAQTDKHGMSVSDPALLTDVNTADNDNSDEWQEASADLVLAPQSEDSATDPRSEQSPDLQPEPVAQTDHYNDRLRPRPKKIVYKKYF